MIYRATPSLTLHELEGEHSYEAEAAKCVGGTGFHRWFFLQALSEAIGLRLRAFAVDAGRDRLGVVPVLLRRRGVVSTANYLPVPHVGPLPSHAALRDGRVSDLLRAIDPVLRRERVVVTRWNFGPGVPVSAGQFAWGGFQSSVAENFVLPAATSLDDYLKGLEPKQRAAIRRCESRGLRAEPSTREEIMEWFPSRVSEPYLRQGTAPDYPLAAARVLAERLATHPRMLWRTVRNDEKVLAVNSCVVGEERLWGWILAGERVPGPSPHVAAYWDAIRWSRDRGLACDFGGAPTSGIRDFKLQMGGQAERCVSAERVRPRAYRRLRSLHAGFSGMMAARLHTQAGHGKSVIPDCFQ